jgi:hypothetical protein
MHSQPACLYWISLISPLLDTMNLQSHKSQCHLVDFPLVDTMHLWAHKSLCNFIDFPTTCYNTFAGPQVPYITPLVSPPPPHYIQQTHWPTSPYLTSSISPTTIYNALASLQIPSLPQAFNYDWISKVIYLAKNINKNLDILNSKLKPK